MRTCNPINGRCMKENLQKYLLEDLQLGDELEKFEVIRKEARVKITGLERKIENVEPIITDLKEEVQVLKDKSEVVSSFKGEFNRKKNELEDLEKGIGKLYKDLEKAKEKENKADRDELELQKTKLKELYNNMSNGEEDFKEYKLYKSKADAAKANYDYKIQNKDQLATEFYHYFQHNI